jgi:hypothetical protein
MPNTRFQLGDDGQLTRARRNEPQSPSDVAISGGTKTTAIWFQPARFEHLANGRGVDADTDGGTDRGDPALGPDRSWKTTTGPPEGSLCGSMTR